jgi:hypothetical protein
MLKRRERELGAAGDSATMLGVCEEVCCDGYKDDSQSRRRDTCFSRFFVPQR